MIRGGKKQAENTVKLFKKFIYFYFQNSGQCDQFNIGHKSFASFDSLYCVFIYIQAV